jgi:hypothetical protein
MPDSELRVPGVEDFDYIRKRIEELKKEQEEANKASVTTPVTTENYDYCSHIVVGSDLDYLLGFNELSTGSRPIFRDSLKYANEIVFEDYELDDEDCVITDEITIARLYGLELNFS